MVQRDEMRSPVLLSVIVPAYNEEESIRGTLDDLIESLSNLAITYEIVVVDDGSEDDTPRMVSENESVTLVRHPYNMGYGAALKTGIRKSRGRFILITDADGSYPAREIPRLLEYKDRFDMVVAARIGENVHMPLMRRPAKFVLTKLADFLVNRKIPDLTSGMRVFKRETAQRFLNLLPSGFSFTATITLTYLCKDYSVKYVPISYSRRRGKSKINPLRDTIAFASLIVRTVTYFNPLKVFGFFAITLFCAAAAVFAWSTYFLGRLMDVTTIVLLIASVQVGLFGLLADVVTKKLDKD